MWTYKSPDEQTSDVVKISNLQKTNGGKTDRHPIASSSSVLTIQRLKEPHTCPASADCHELPLRSP